MHKLALTKEKRVTIVDLPHLMVETVRHANDLFHQDRSKSRQSAFSKKDYDFFTTKGGPTKANERVSQFRDNIKFHVFLSPRPYSPSEGISQEMANSMADDRDGRMNVVFGNNVTAPNWSMPMTAWIMAHRMSHVAQAKYHTIGDLNTDLIRKVRDLVGEWKSCPFYHSVINALYDQRHLMELVSSSMTMKSARDRVVPGIDVMGELMAQHQHSKVTLLSSDEIIARRETYRTNGFVPRKQVGDLEDLMQHSWQCWDDTRPAMEELLNNEMHLIFDKMRGQYLGF